MELSCKSRTLLCRFLLAACFAPVAVRAQSAEKLSQVKKVYVESLGQERSAGETRSHLIRHLDKSRALQVTQNLDEADAVLKGTAQIWTTGYINPGVHSHTLSEPTYSGYLSAELVGKGGQTLWSYLVTPSKFPLGGIPDDLAAQLASRLLADIKRKARPEPSATEAREESRATLKGAGATFPAPLYKKWFELFEERNPGVTITYDAVGSGAGIERLATGATDFGASDMPLSDQALAGAHRRFLQIPVALGAVVPIYNVPRLSGEIRFTPEILAGIYLGKIKKWNDPLIQAANRSASLPDADISVIHRSDGSGTTFVWTDYLSKVSPEWRVSIGAGLSVHWPVGNGAAYNEGVASAVRQTPNSIGYVEFIYAVQHEFNFAAVRNPAGRFIRADISSVTAAVQDAGDSLHDLRLSLTNSPGNAAYPIASFTWLLLPGQSEDKIKRAALLDLVRWMLTSGQKSSSALGYAPLPPEFAKRALESLDAVK